MANDKNAAEVIRTALAEQKRDYLWLSRETQIPYKRVLNAIKHEKREISFTDAILAADALGMQVPDLVSAA